MNLNTNSLYYNGNTFPEGNHILTLRCLKFPKLNQVILPVRTIHMNSKRRKKEKQNNTKTVKSNLFFFKKRLL